MSSNAADAFAAGLKGRYKEDRYDEHKLVGSHFAMDVLEGGKVVHKDIPMRNALNEVLRTEYIKDCQRGVDRWNKHLERAGHSARLRLPSKRFCRHIGLYADMPFDADGRLLERGEWDRRRGEWLPTEKDRAYVATLQKAVREPAQIANWIARPARGIKGLPFEYEYVRLD